jgi:DNA-binding response OmpR family regulator
MEKVRILAVTDSEIGGGLCKDLQKQYDVKCTKTLRPTLQMIHEFDPEVIIIDVDANTPGKVRRISQASKAHYRRPFVILVKSGRDKPRNVKYYDAILSRPFIFRKLKSTINKLLASRPEYVIQLPPFVLDRRTQVLMTPKGVYQLNPKLAQLMEAFMTHPGEPINPIILMKNIWDTDIVEDIRTLHVHIHWLREIIEDNVSDPKYLKTVAKNKGYIIDLPGKLVIGGKPLYMPEKT